MEVNDNINHEKNIYLELFHKIPAAIFYCNNEGLIINCNESVTDFLNINQSWAIGNFIYNIGMFSKVDYQEMIRFIDDFPENSLIEYYDYIFNSKAISVKYTPIKNENGFITARIFTILDISKRKLIEQETLEKELFLLNVQELVGVGSWFWDLRSNKMIWSDETKKIFGIDNKNDAPSYEKFLDQVFPDDKEIVVNSLLNAINTKESYSIEHRIISSDGKIIEVAVNARAVFNNVGKVTALYGAIKDITAENNLKDSLLESLDMTYNMLNVIDSGVMYFDRDNKVKSFNEKFKSILHIEDDWTSLHISVVFNKIADSLKNPKEYLRVIEQYQYFGDIDLNHDFVLIDNTIVNFRIKKFILSNKKVRYVWLIKDITDWVNSENQLLAFNKNLKYAVSNLENTVTQLKDAKQEAENAQKAQSLFIANVSHELRSPLNSIIGYSNLLINEIDNERHRNFIEAISLSGSNLLMLINDILDFSKIQADKLIIQKEFYNLKPIVIDIIKMFGYQAETKNIDLTYELDNSSQFDLMIDKTRIKQILINLLSNALKFTDTGGVSLSLKLINLNSETVDLILEVKDSGIGIDEDQLVKIFEPFRQSQKIETGKYGGTGLGLSITRKIANLMNGEVIVNSKLGEGSLFTVTLKDITYRNAVRADINLNAIDLSDYKVLIIIYNDNNHNLFEEYFKVSGAIYRFVKPDDSFYQILNEFSPDIICEETKIFNKFSSQYIEYLMHDSILHKVPLICLSTQTEKEFIDVLLNNYDDIIYAPFDKEKVLTILAEYLFKIKTTKRINIKQKNDNSINFELLSKEAQEIININSAKVKRYLDDLNNMFIISKVIEFGEFFLDISTQSNSYVLIEKANKLLEETKSYNVDLILRNLSDINKLVSK